MGLMRFLVPDRDRLAPDALDRAYLTGMDEVPWHSRIHTGDGWFAIERAEADSGNLHIPWIVKGHGELVLSTASLMEREPRYHLPVELARGTLNRVRNQIAAWEQAGLVLNDTVRGPLTEAQRHFSLAATIQQNPLAAARHAESSLSAALDTITALCGSYAEQALAQRRRQPIKSSMLLAANLGSTPPKPAIAAGVSSAFNAAVVPLVWREVEAGEGRRDWTMSDAQVDWCRAQGLKIIGGPLVELDRGTIPDWLYLWEGDDENLTSVAADYVRAAVARYRGKVQLWQCAARMNTSDVLSLSEEQRLRLTVTAIEAVRQVDPRTPVVIMVDQPWAEFMNRKPCDLAPLYFADALVRADLGLAGIGLEVNLGYWPGGTQPRDLLDFSRQIDRWSCLERPLLVQLTIPSGAGADRQARSPAKPQYAAAGGEPTSATQCQWIEQLVPLLCAKQSVQGIVWNQLTDSLPHDFAHGGLWDASDQPKPGLAAMEAMRRNYSA